MDKIMLTETELKILVENSVRRVISEATMSESDMDENIWQNIKAGFQGAKSGYNTNKALTNNNDDFQRNGKTAANDNWYSNFYDTTRPDAIGGKNGINQMIDQARKYEAIAQQLRAKAKELAIYHDTKENMAYRFKGGRAFNYNNNSGAVDVQRLKNGPWAKPKVDNSHLFGASRTPFY